ncbi:MAG: hypothetical protein PHF89_04865 [Eubacteriales bacterium]|nr:hypothetical protein [Eubacteriales bacterium]
MNGLLALGKYLDQPRLVGKFSKAVPGLLIGSGVLFTAKHVMNTPKEDKYKEFVKTTCVLSATIASALIATRGIGQIKIGGKVLFKGFEGLSEKIDLKQLGAENTKLIDEFLKNNQVTENILKILQKAKNKVLKISEIKTVFTELGKEKKGQGFLNKLIPNPENIDSKHILGEIKRLSLMGLIPVLGGIAGGIAGDKLTENNWAEKIPNKIKEGSYQYLANIFLCNVGAGAALAALENFNVKSKFYRAVGMLGGIIAFGLIGGSAIANIIGRTCLDPIIEKGRQYKHHKHGHHHPLPDKEKIRNRSLYYDRKPEAIDIGLHVDDVATVAVLSGLKWIEPALPILYSVSGYRAGIGYRNGHQH